MANKFFTLAVIEKNKPGKTGYFVDKKLVRSVPFVERHMLDWILEEEKMYQDIKVKFDGSYLAEYNQNKLLGRGIYIKSPSYIYIGYSNNNDDAPGNFIQIFDHGRVDVGECYLEGDESHSNYIKYIADGTTVPSNPDSDYNLPIMAVFASSNTDYDDF